jgi:hypothetical protein
MSRAVPKLKTKLVRSKAACEALCISKRSFARHWTKVFTDPRDPNHARNAHRLVYEDELAVAVEAGGGVSQRAKTAVLNYRAEEKRK